MSITAHLTWECSCRVVVAGAAVLMASCAIAGVDPQVGGAHDIPLEADVWYAAEPWHRDEKNLKKLATWAGQLADKWREVGKEPTDTFNVRWAISALALHHAARVVGDRGDDWRNVALSISARRAKQLAENATASTKAFSYHELGFRNSPNYASPFLLLYLEHQAAGVETARLWRSVKDDDRDPISSLGFSASMARERLAARVVLNLMSQTGNEVGDVKNPPKIDEPFLPNVSSSYIQWTGNDPGVTGTILMGMQSAMSLRVLDAVETMADRIAVRPPKGDQPVTSEDFRNRWCDTLMHVMLTYAADRAKDDTFDGRKSNGLIERSDISGPELDLLPTSWSFGYRFARDGGQLTRQVMVRGPGKAPEGVAARRFKYNKSKSAYQTASGGYALLVSAQLLRRTLRETREKGKTVVGHQYQLRARPSGEEWELFFDGRAGQASMTLTLAKRPRYTGVTMTGPSVVGKSLAIDDLVDEALAALATDLYHGTKLLVKNPYELFAIGKFLATAGYPQVLGRYLWHRDFCDCVASDVTFQEDRYDDAFVILMVLQAYQPLYPGGGG